MNIITIPYVNNFFDVEYLSLTEAQLTDTLIADFINEKETATGFGFFYKDYGQLIEKAKHRKFGAESRRALIQSLRNHYQGFESDFSEAYENVEALESEKVYTVTTGHQLCLFTGPQYFVIKILHTIKLAAQLNEAAKLSGDAIRFVPIYWMHTEDHDVAEVNHVVVNGQKFEWNAQQKVAAGNLDTTGISEVLRDIKEKFGYLPHINELIELFEKGYGTFQNLAQSTFYIVNALFKEYGLVVFNPNQPELKKLFTHIVKDELINGNSCKQVNETNQRLLQKGYKPKVNPRELNLFYLKDGFRNRMERMADGTFSVLNTEVNFTDSDVLNEMEIHPERFSPNVVLRPLYQETILPNVAYVGGAGEIAYWLQYKSLFEFYQIQYPTLVLRNSVMWLEEVQQMKMAKLGIEIMDIFKSEAELTTHLITSNAGQEISLQTERETIQEQINHIIKKGAGGNPTLETALKAESVRMMQVLDAMEAKIKKAAKLSVESEITQALNLKNKLFPANKLLERQEGIITTYGKWGKDWFKVIYDALRPLLPNSLVVIKALKSE